MHRRKSRIQEAFISKNQSLISVHLLYFPPSHKNHPFLPPSTSSLYLSYTYLFCYLHFDAFWLPPLVITFAFVFSCHPSKNPYYFTVHFHLSFYSMILICTNLLYVYLSWYKKKGCSFLFVLHSSLFRSNPVGKKMNYVKSYFFLSLLPVCPLLNFL